MFCYAVADAECNLVCVSSACMHARMWFVCSRTVCIQNVDNKIVDSCGANANKCTHTRTLSHNDVRHTTQAPTYTHTHTQMQTYNVPMSTQILRYAHKSPQRKISYKCVCNRRTKRLKPRETREWGPGKTCDVATAEADAVNATSSATFVVSDRHRYQWCQLTNHSSPTQAWSINS